MTDPFVPGEGIEILNGVQVPVDYTVIPMQDMPEPLKRLSGEVLTFPTRAEARQYAEGLPGPAHYTTSYERKP